MFLQVRIKLTATWLGDGNPDQEGVRRFKKDGSGNLILTQDFVRNQLRRTAPNLGLEAKLITAIHVEPIDPPTLHLYRKRITAVRHQMYESLRKGSELTLKVFIDESRKSVPDQEQVDVILRMTGKMFGLSPYGSKSGMGRFEVLSICPIDPKELFSTGETPASTSQAP